MKIFFTCLAILLVFIAVMLLVLIKRTQRISNSKIKSITKLFFITTQISALIWVFISYAIAIYSTLALGQVYTMSELSEPAITTILGVNFLKVLENIFEHNEGSVFGTSKKEDTQYD